MCTHPHTEPKPKFQLYINGHTRNLKSGLPSGFRGTDSLMCSQLTQGGYLMRCLLLCPPSSTGPQLSFDRHGKMML